MTDADLVAKKLAFIETCVADLRHHANLDVLADDIQQQRFVLHTLQIAIQAAIDVASHVVSDERAGEPHTYRELFMILVRRDLLPLELARELGDMAGFRNIVVHGYGAIDLSKVREIVTSRLDDLLAFAAHIRSLLR